MNNKKLILILIVIIIVLLAIWGITRILSKDNGTTPNESTNENIQEDRPEELTDEIDGTPQAITQTQGGAITYENFEPMNAIDPAGLQTEKEGITMDPTGIKE